MTSPIVYDLTLGKKNRNWNLAERFFRASDFYLQKNCFVIFKRFRWLRMAQMYVYSYEKLVVIIVTSCS